MLPPNLVSIFSTPRSGSSWLGQLFNSSPDTAYRFQPLFSYAFKGRLTMNSSRQECMAFLEELLVTKDKFILQADGNYHVDQMGFSKSPVRSSHLVFKEVRYINIVRNLMEQLPEIMVVGLVRHPCAVIDSWIHAPREFKPEWSVQEQWRSGALKNQGRSEECFGFDKWKEVALLFTELEKRHPDRMKVVRYADLNADPMGTTKDLFTFCDLEFGPSTEDFIRTSRSADGGDANSVYRKARPDEAWKSRLPTSIADTILGELTGSPLERFL